MIHSINKGKYQKSNKILKDPNYNSNKSKQFQQFQQFKPIHYSQTNKKLNLTFRLITLYLFFPNNLLMLNIHLIV